MPAPAIPSPGPLKDPQPETVPTGIDTVDRLADGLPRGRITEIVGPASSGRTSLLLSVLAQITDREEVCALIDPVGTFDPASAARTGVDLERLLWVRAAEPDILLTLKAADLLVQAGGFGLIGVDLGEFARAEIQRVSLSSWFRLQRAVEHTPTILLFLGQQACTRTCASLVLGLGRGRIDWSPRLFRGIHPRIEILRSRVRPGTRWNRSPESFCIQTGYCTAVSPRPEAFSMHNASNVEGVSLQ